LSNNPTPSAALQLAANPRFTQEGFDRGTDLTVEIERVVTLGGGRMTLVRHVYLPSVAAWVTSLDTAATSAG